MEQKWSRSRTPMCARSALVIGSRRRSELNSRQVGSTVGGYFRLCAEGEQVIQQSICLLVLAEVCTCSSLTHRPLGVLVTVGGKSHDLDFWQGIMNLTCRVDAIHHGHRNVHDNDVWLQG